MIKTTITGGIPLKGSVKVSGAKNAALPLLSGLILLDGKSQISGVPNLTDIIVMVRMLNSLGLRCELRSDQTVYANAEQKVKHLVPYELMTKMRASFFVAGPILAKTGFVKMPVPGGCAIGSRPVDIHLKGFEALGAVITQEHGFFDIKAKKLKGSKVVFDFPSVGATENVMMAATLAEGTTELHNSACEPEIVDLADLLCKAGAKIKGAGTETILIEGVTSLRGVNHEVIPDRIEAGTLMIAAAITKGDCVIENVILDHVYPLVQKMRDMGIIVEEQGRNVRVSSDGIFKAVDIETRPFPGFPTDMQAQMMSLLSLAKGTSVVTENIFENRFMHAHELHRMGADIVLKDRSAIVRGVEKLSSAPIKATDLRAGAALWLAGLAAEGDTEIFDEGHIVRGYDRLDEKLKKLGLAYNYTCRQSVSNKHQHFCIKIEPRDSVWAGVELDAGLIINSVPPEEAAKYYRKK
jgi:UDP-N-acetylglucosamine 1-carboxyvinyltransferase